MEFDELFAKPCGGVHNNIEFATSLTGSPNAPATADNANDPGLESKSIFGGIAMKKHHWLLIIVGVLLLFWGLNYFGVIGAAAAASA